ncbi:hypothetical protein PROFUN_01200 [Planoprotostelium fungivorum]|uniref:Meiotically up-regulated protein n=1 Tax=Planoprotostelium fungivorum TaxID=1890364 RepID=A0A2P6NCM5_9EUKA|nr:hypothetical protein PROFUN_01200 [Planoprotostelium fungivorum]
MQRTFFLCLLVASSLSLLPKARPPVDQRKFTSNVVEDLIAQYQEKMQDEDLATLFSNCFPNTLDTTVDYFNDSQPFPTSFVITGDITAMWLRDSMNQLMPYVGLMKSDVRLQKLFLGAIHTQAYFINLDPYANAFNFNATQVESRDDQVKPTPPPLVHESKYELDSLVSFLKLSRVYFEQTGDDSYFKSSQWIDAIRTVIRTCRLQQRGTLEALGDEDYLFSRQTTTSTETLFSGGLSTPVRRCGLVKSAFRPSDDATLFPYLVPANAMLTVELMNVAKIIRTLDNETELYKDCVLLAKEVRLAIEEHAIVNHPVYGQIIAYEVNGFGGYNVMDDANVPSLLALPYMEYMKKDDPLYLRTREFVLSNYNPYFFNGSAAAGVGGPHVGINYVWPMSLIIKAMTTDDKAEISQVLDTLKDTTADTGFMHESFNVNDPTQFTRPWFAWVNGLYGQLILQLATEHPDLIFKQ